MNCDSIIKKGDKNPLISVVMAAYNAESFIGDAIDSIICQSYPNWELIIVDDCSLDKTIDIVRSYSNDRIILLQNEINKGPAYSRNRALNVAKGDFIAILDSDDIAVRNRFELQLREFQENPNLVLLAGGSNIIDEKGRDIGCTFSSAMSTKNFKLTALFRCPIVHSSVMYRADFIRRKSLCYDENYPCNQDYKLWTDIAALDDVEIKVNSVVYVKYRVSQGQISQRKKSVQLHYGKLLRKAYMDKLGLNFPERTLDVLSYMDNSKLDETYPISVCEKVLFDLFPVLTMSFPKSMVEKVILRNFRFLYKERCSSMFVAIIKYLRMILKLKLGV